MKLLTADSVKLGFVGLGNMESRIAQRLLANGYQVFVYNRNIAKTDALAVRGGIVTKNIFELADCTDVILSCLTNDEAVQCVFTGPAGLFAAAQPGTIVLDDLSRKLAGTAQAWL